MNHGEPYQNESSAVPVLCANCKNNCGPVSYSLVGFPGRAWCAACFGRLAEPATPSPAPQGNPGRTDAQRLDAYKTNLDWAIDCASLKLNRLKPGSSAYKTQAGYLRGLVDARESLISEMGARQ